MDSLFEITNDDLLTLCRILVGHSYMVPNGVEETKKRLKSKSAKDIFLWMIYMSSEKWMMLHSPLSEMPLYLNHSTEMNRYLAMWRLSIGK